MTTASTAMKLTAPAHDTTKTGPAPDRWANRPGVTVLPRPARWAQPNPRNSRINDDQRPIAAAKAALAAPVAGDPTVPTKPVPLEEALAKARQYIDSSAGPDRARDIVRLRAQVTRSAGLVHYLARARTQLLGVVDRLGDTSDDHTDMAADMWYQAGSLGGDRRLEGSRGRAAEAARLAGRAPRNRRPPSRTGGAGPPPTRAAAHVPLRKTCTHPVVPTASGDVGVRR